MNSPRRPETTRSGAQANTLLIVLILLIVALIVVLLTCHHQQQDDTISNTGNSNTTNTNKNTPTDHHPIDTAALARLELPQARAGDEIIQHRGYTLCYREAAEQAAWVAYVATAAHALGDHTERTNRFRTDPLVTTGSATNADYEGSGYDRGHLAPAEDMGWSKKTMSESFYYSNMSPQVPAFNRGVWKRLEELLRYWATEYDSIYIVTGPVLTDGLPAIGPDRVSVPAYFYKVVLVYNSGGVKTIGFLLPNEASDATLRRFIVPVDTVEARTGLDFFPRLPDDVEAKVEGRADAGEWKWTRQE